jgi:NAD(P)-dependent dehydrogenase (short-subunit alcohol dehydrogenase family)
MTSKEASVVIDWDLESHCDHPGNFINDDNRFAGKTIIITGAGGQFGREGCLWFAKRGAHVAGIDMSKAGLKDTFSAMKAEFGASFDFKPYVCDVSDFVQVNAVIDAIKYRFKRIDLLWNNAGYQGQINPLLSYDPADFAKVMSVNVTGAFIVLQAVAKKMKEQGGGGYSIVNTASVAGLRGTPAMVAYASSKAAVLAMTVCASKDLAPDGIRVNAVSPALIGPGTMWDRQNELHAKSGSPYFSTDSEEVAKNKIASVPMKRLGSVEEVVKSVSFLLSDESSYTTGINLVIDGGMSAGLKA